MSDQSSRIDGFIERFATERSLDLHPLNSAGYSEVVLGSTTVRMNLVDEYGVLLLLSPVMRVPERNVEAFYRRLLELSFLATSKAAFAVDKKTDMAFLRILCRLEGLEYEGFEEVLLTITHIAEKWTDLLREQFGGA